MPITNKPCARRFIKNATRLLVLFITTALAVTNVSPSSRTAFEPLPLTTTTPMLSGTTVPIKAASGDQTNPSVSCELAVYTDDDFAGVSTINYVDFASNTEHVLPGNGLDRLAATDGRRIAYSQLEADGDHILIYDVTSQSLTHVPGDNYLAPSIGGNLVAFVEWSPTVTNQEIGVYDQNTGNVTQLTNDASIDTAPRVSADGKVVVWEKCDSTVTNCDIYQATQTGPGAFTTQLLTGQGDDRYPDTNGQLVVYISDKSGENDIYLQRVGGSNEMHLAIPGDQRDLHISGNVLVFESLTATGYDVFLYDLSTARLYQVTNTPGLDERLSDVVFGCNGEGRIVWSQAGGFGDIDVYEFTFHLNDSMVDQLNELISLVHSFNLPAGTETSLIAKVQDALAAIDLSDTPTACASLTAFINACESQSGKKLTVEQANQLINAAAQIKTDLGCP